MSTEPGRQTLELLRQRVVDLEAENFELQERLTRLEHLRADISLAGFVQSLALDVALGEATMPDRVVTPVAVSASTYLLPSDGGLGLRFQTPELADRPAGLSSTSLELAKVPSVDGRAPPSLYAVLQEKQRVYGVWSAGRIEGRIVAEVGKVLAATGTWTLSFLAESAVRIGELELKLAGSARDEGRSEAAKALLQLARSVLAKPRSVAGDLYALAAALDATTPPSP
ncbi:MAG: hypothetical protein ACRDM8_04465 [Gaiellaceae bacterium]